MNYRYISLVALLCMVCAGAVPGNDTEPKTDLSSRRKGTTGGISCRNERDEEVDWFIVYKLPTIPSSSKTLEIDGLAHVYMDESTGGRWRQSSVSFNTENHAVAHTLQQLYKDKSKDAFHVMYNDEQPGGKSSTTKGHAKGVAMFDQTSGFWLLHSVPKFPAANRYSFPSTGRVFGQVLMCVSFPYARLGAIVEQLQLYEPYIYSSSSPSEISKHFKNIKSLLDGDLPSSPLKRETKISSTGGVSFTSFAKSAKWGGELYAGFVAPSLKQALNVETWQNGRGDEPSSCKGAYHVQNIKQVKLSNSVEFANSKDHSKWAVSVSKSSDWICVGGINRQHGQITRGGGTMCMKNKNVWKTFTASVKSTESCRNNDNLVK